MEDTYCVHDGGRFAGVFDGHGGGGVSKYISKTIYDKINKHQAAMGSASSSNPSLGVLVKSIGYAFDELDDDVLDADELEFQGSTAVAVYVHQDSQTQERTIVSANIGDSRAILSRGGVAMDLTRDHKPDDKYEKERILAMGEEVEWDSYCQISRVKNLSVSRAIGDRFAKPVVSGEAEIQLFSLDDLPTTNNGKDDCIILGSDGLWDVMTSQDCVEFVQKRLTPSTAQTRNMSKSELMSQRISRRKNMSRFLADEAARRGSLDNICVVLVWLDEPRGALHP
jgi:serine/threonine protein phosphatase PrpC